MSHPFNGDLGLKKIIYTILWCHKSYSVQFNWEKKKYFYTFIFQAIWHHPTPGGSWFKQIWLYPRMFPHKVQLFWPNDFKIFWKTSIHCIFICKTIDPKCDPTHPSVIIIWSNLNQHYPRMLLHNLKLFLPISFYGENIFKDCSLNILM